jgi:hypothetical protein
MRSFGAFILGLVLGAAILWLVVGKPDLTRSAKWDDKSENLSERKGTPELTSENIKRELKETGTVIREKTEVVADKIADATITATVDGKYLMDPDLSIRRIDVSTTDGVVTLNGTAPNAALIKRAIQLAMDTPGVNKVVSNLQIPAEFQDTTPTTNPPPPQ